MVNGYWRMPALSQVDYVWKCPYGKIGDRLWVRETWGYCGSGSGGTPEKNISNIEYHADGARGEIEFKSFRGMMAAVPKQNIKHKEDCEYEEGQGWFCDCIHKWWERKKKIPSIHMPRLASRITLEITDIRVEQNNNKVWVWVIEFKVLTT